MVYGNMSGKSPVWPWQSWVFKNLKVTMLVGHSMSLVSNKQYVLHPPQAQMSTDQGLNNPLHHLIDVFLVYLLSNRDS